MTALANLSALVAKWRGIADRGMARARAGNEYCDGRQQAMRDCADDLEDTLSALTAEVGKGEDTHRCAICSATGTPDPVVGCTRCGWDEMRPIPPKGLDYVPGELDRTAPERIWLQIDTNGDSDSRDEQWPGPDHVTWQDESIGGLEIQYVRADLALSTATPAGECALPERLLVLPHPLEPEAKVTRQTDYARGWNAAIDAMLAAAPAPEDGWGDAESMHFNDAEALASWLESLHECDASGAVGSRKWDAAQRAAAAIRRGEP